MHSYLLQIQQAAIDFQGRQAFTHLDFSWKEGERWAILSDSGWLQTAFLETLRGNTLLKSGKMTRFFDLEYLQEKRMQMEAGSFRDLVAYVSQRYEFRNKFNQQNFYFQQRFNAAESEETETLENYLTGIFSKRTGPWTLENVLELLNLGSLRHKSLLKLSNGETRRLALAAGLMKQPVVFLMDHPTTGLDRESRKNFGQLLNVIQQAGMQLLITCNPQDIPEGMDYVATLDHCGISKIWSSKEFALHQPMSKVKSWDWNSLRKLLPSNSPEEERLVSLRNVSISYPGKTILDRVNWEISSGEHWQLKGPNGSGKSTLISLLIAENPQAYAQDIWLFGRKRGTGESIWDVKRPTGFVAPELIRFFPSNQTCKKVILSGLFDTMGLFKKVLPEQEQLAQEWMRLFELEAVADLAIHRLSLVQQRWALLARALIKRPQLLILDEASQGLDSAQRHLFTATVQQICQHSTLGLIFVSHYPEDVPEAVDRVFELI